MYKISWLTEDEIRGLSLQEYACYNIYKTYTYKTAFDLSPEILTAYKAGKYVLLRVLEKRKDD